MAQIAQSEQMYPCESWLQSFLASTVKVEMLLLFQISL